jgi:hypothetical protein
VADLPSVACSEDAAPSALLFRSLLYVNNRQATFPQPTPPVPLTYLEQKRKEAQLQYREEQVYIQTHKADFERLLEEDRQAMAKEMSGSLWGALDALAGGGPKKIEGKKGDITDKASTQAGSSAPSSIES